MVIRYLDELDTAANAIGSVNTIAKDGDRLVGYNTDAFGFQRSLKGFLKPEVERALVLGTGGAAKAVHHVLGKLNVSVQQVSRNDAEGLLQYDDLTVEILASHQLIVNCTPLGMSPDISSCPDIPYHGISRDHLVYDLVYNPRKTIFLKRSEERGAQVKNGLEMLHFQADKAWQIWQSYLDTEHEGSK